MVVGDWLRPLKLFWDLHIFDMCINMLMSLKQLWNNSKTIRKRFGIVSAFCFTCKSVWNKALFWICFGIVLRCFVSVVRATLYAWQKAPSWENQHLWTWRHSVACHEQNRERQSLQFSIKKTRQQYLGCHEFYQQKLSTLEYLQTETELISKAPLEAD